MLLAHDMLSVNVCSLAPDVGFQAQHVEYPTDTEGLTLSQPPTMPCNMSDQWHQNDPVGNKGYEVWQQCARWSPSSCLFLQAMGSQTEEWKSDLYIDFGGGKFVGPSGNRKKKCIWLPPGGCTKKDSSTLVYVEDMMLKAKENWTLKSIISPHRTTKFSISAFCNADEVKQRFTARSWLLNTPFKPF